MAFIVKQLAVGGFDHNFSYLLSDSESGATAIIDPCGDICMIHEALQEIANLKPVYILLTHGHGDHCSGLEEIKKSLKIPLAAHPECPKQADIPLANGQHLAFGKSWIECIYSPGHSNDSVLYRTGDNRALFTGDTLFIDYCGFCQAKTMFETMQKVIYPLPDSLEVYPGHDYGRCPHAPLKEEKIRNPYLASKDFPEFEKLLKYL